MYFYAQLNIIHHLLWFHSIQILLWVNTSENVCDNPYEWACGKFEDVYRNHLKLDSFGFTGGEWNMKEHDDYEGKLIKRIV